MSDAKAVLTFDAGDDQRAPMAPSMNKKRKNVEFYAHLCYDVLLEVILYGNRCKLAELAKIGRRFNRVIGGATFGERPYLRLNLALRAWRPELVRTSIGSDYPFKSISSTELATIPRYIRFNTIRLSYHHSPSIRSLCDCFQQQLQSFNPKTLLVGSTLKIWVPIKSNDASSFNDQSSLLVYLADELLSIFNGCRSYEFFIFIYQNSNSSANGVTSEYFISSILEMEPIKRCSNLILHLYGETGANIVPILPVESITNWLTSSFDVNQNKYKNRGKEGKFLQIKMDSIQNRLAISDHLNEVAKDAKFSPFLFQFGGFSRARKGQIIANVLPPHPLYQIATANT